MSVAAYLKKVKIGSQSEGFNDIPAQSATLNHAGDVLDDTEMATNQGHRTRILGLRDWSISMTIIYDPANAVVTTLRDMWLNRVTESIQYLPDGTIANGFEGEVIVENFNMSGDVGGLEMVEVSLQAAGVLGVAV